MKIYLAIIMGLIFADLGHAQVAKQTDAEIATALLGTWEAFASRTSDRVINESTYTRDGMVTGYTTPKTGTVDANGQLPKLKVRAHWKVDQGALVVDDYQSEPAGIFPPDYRTKYEIVSLTKDEAVFRIPGAQQELYRRRKKD